MPGFHKKFRRLMNVRLKHLMATGCVLAGVLFLTAGTQAQALFTNPIPPPPANPAEEPIVVAPCATPPHIDGLLDDDPCWKTATHAVGFYRYLGTAPIVEQTEAWICADRNHLYVAFHCIEDHPELIKAQETLRNGDISNDDSVSIMIDSQNTHRSTSEFSVSARGTQTESLEGGTADNITWAGDWQAEVRRVKDGWTAEFAIPWALLRHPRNTHAMAIMLLRKLAREPSQEVWPYMSRDQQQHSILFMTAFTGIAPIDYPTRPILLPYVLGTAGEGYAARYGMDVKYPLSTTMTGVLTLNPDFQDVEQQVTNIAFSYDPIYYNDNRPFFADSSAYLPYSDVFYSRAIGQIDEGAKVAGKQGGTTVDAIATNSSENGGRSDVVTNMTQEIGTLSDVHFAMAQDSQFGVPGTRVFKTEGVYGWQTGQTQYSFTANHMPSWVDNQMTGAKDYAGFSSSPPGGKPSVALDWNDIGPGFTNNIGYVPETNIKGEDYSVMQTNVFDTGKLDGYFAAINGSYYDQHTGGFFRKDINYYGFIDFREGWNLALSITPSSERQQYHDHLNEITLNWAEHTLYAKGGIDETFGQQEDQRYSLLTIYQGLGLTKTVALSGNLSQALLGDSITTEAVLTGTYRLSFERSIGLRAVTLGHDSNLFISFEQKARKGDDIYFLVGNPNSASTQGLITLKIVHPF
jgi:hypothetical protein